MRVSDMVYGMKANNRRKLAGRIVHDEAFRQGTIQQAARNAHMSPSTFYRVVNGDDPTVTGLTLRPIESALGLTDNLLDFIIEGDAETITSLGDNEIRPGLKRTILTGLAQIDAEEVEGNEQDHG